jgi:hypothetical protein
VKLGEKITALQQIVSPFGKVRDSCRAQLLLHNAEIQFISVPSLLVDDI